MRNLAQPRPQVARCKRERVLDIRLQKQFAVEKNHSRARRRRTTPERIAPPGIQTFDQRGPSAGVGKELSAGLDEHRFLRQPEVDRTRRDDGVVLINLAGEQVGLDSGLNEDAGLGGGRFADQEKNRQLRELGFFADVRLREAQFGVANERLDFFFGRGGVGLATLRRRFFGALAFVPPNVHQAEGGHHQSHQEHAHDHGGGAGQVQQGSDKPRGRQHRHHHDGGDHVVKRGTHPATATLARTGSGPRSHRSQVRFYSRQTARRSRSRRPPR